MPSLPSKSDCCPLSRTNGSHHASRTSTPGVISMSEVKQMRGLSGKTSAVVLLASAPPSPTNPQTVIEPKQTRPHPQNSVTEDTFQADPRWAGFQDPSLEEETHHFSNPGGEAYPAAGLGGNQPRGWPKIYIASLTKNARGKATS